MRKLIIVLTLVSMFINLANATLTKAEVASTKKIIGYFPNWGVYDAHRNYFVKDIPWDKLTHVQVAFAKTEADTLEVVSPDLWADIKKTYGEAWNSPYKGNFGQLKKIRVAYPHVSVLISIGGWTLSSQFADAGSSDAKAIKFADSAIKFMTTYELDGIDIDWEFPTKVRKPDKVDNYRDEGTLDETPASKQGFTRLLRVLREKLDAQGATDGRYYQLSAAVGSSPALINATEPDKYIGYLDFLNIMSYDLHGAWDKTTNHQSPLFVNPDLADDNISVDNAVKLLHDTYGVPKNKLIVGSPFYTRGWKGVDCSTTTTLKNSDGSDLLGLNCKANGGAAGRWDGGRAAGVNSWYDVVNKMRGKDGFKVYRDEYAKVPYLYSATKKEFYTYEDEISAKARVDYVKSNEYGGIIIWELSADTRTSLGDPANTNLLDIIYKELFDNQTITNITATPKKVIDNSATQDVETEKKLDTSAKKTDKSDGAANVGTSTGLSKFDPTHGPQYNKHYAKGEKVLNNAGEVCTAKYWVNVSPDTSLSAWDCQSSDTATVVPTEMKTEKKADVKVSADVLAKKLKTEDESSGELPSKTEIKIDTNDTIVKVEDAKASDANDNDVIVAPPSASELQTALDESVKCHVDQIYNNGDICNVNGVWYSFKWWTSYKKDIVAPSMVLIPDNEVKVPTITVISAKGLKTWKSTRTYPKKGIRVIYQNNVYESKWWTSNNQPIPFVGNTPWKHLGLADNSKVATDTGVQAKTANEVKNIKTTVDEPIVIADDDLGTTATFDPETNNTIVTEATPKEPAQTKTAPTTKTFFMPFVDVAMWPPYKLKDGMDNGVKHFALSFVNSSGGVCSPTWGNFAAYTIENTTLKLPRQINAVAKAGGSVMISFGGATAHADELANVCSTPAKLAEAYQEVIDKTGVKMIDFDVEGGNSYNKVNVKRRMLALKVIQTNNPNVEISFTLATMPTGLLAPSGLMIVKTAFENGIKFSMINLMLMDYGTAFPSNVAGEFKMAAYSIKALQAVNEQLKSILDSSYSKDSNGEYYNRLGAIPMIGRNDTLNEYFYRSDIKKLRQFCDSVGVRMTSMWSINRDKPLTNGESATSMLYRSTKLSKGSGKDQYGNSDSYEFSKLLKRGGQ